MSSFSLASLRALNPRSLLVTSYITFFFVCGGVGAWQKQGQKLSRYLVGVYPGDLRRVGSFFWQAETVFLSFLCQYYAP